MTQAAFHQHLQTHAALLRCKLLQGWTQSVREPDCILGNHMENQMQLIIMTKKELDNIQKWFSRNPLEVQNPAKISNNHLRPQKDYRMIRPNLRVGAAGLRDQDRSRAWKHSNRNSFRDLVGPNHPSAYGQLTCKPEVVILGRT